jgi:hypothetical protein
MSKQQYEQGRNRAIELEHRISDYLDTQDHEISRKLIEEARRIENDFQSQNNPRSIEDRIKRFLHSFEELKRFETPVMDAQHARWLHDQYEHLQMSLRKFDNY